MVAKRSKRDALGHYAEGLQANGKFSFTREEAIKALKISDNAFRLASLRLTRQTRILKVRNNFYIIIPPEYRATKGLPPTFYIDDLMKFCQQPYYIGLLSAAAMYGAAHQSPQELQIVTSNSLPLLRPGKARIRFVTKKNMQKTPVQQMKVSTGYVQVSTPEATVFDLVKYAKFVGYLNNIATVLMELAEKIDPKKLLQSAKMQPEISTIQRLGYLLDQFCKSVSTKELHAWLKTKKPKFIFLQPDKRSGTLRTDKKWSIIVNTEVEPDV